jgi:hypothetical protein
MTDPSPPAGAAGPLAAYANYCEVEHNALEFLFDFGQFRPEVGAVNIHSRGVVAPVVAKLVARLLADAVTRFEEAHGFIAELEHDDALGALIASIPVFERRAIKARARSPMPPAPTSPNSPR